MLLVLVKNFTKCIRNWWRVSSQEKSPSQTRQNVNWEPIVCKNTEIREKSGFEMKKNEFFSKK